jgi:class 3 adenylate cyclase/tetratricopeptide (TPR) repeat protein
VICPACGTPTVPGARFCFSCGAGLDVAGQAGSELSERRIVTVLFGDLTEFTAWAEDLDPERVKVMTDRVLTALAQAVQAYGGHVDKLTGDGIMAVFGAPRAHEDDPERAVRAAVRMQEEVRLLVAEEAGGGRRLGLRVGLNTGEVLAGMQGALAYTVVGDTVNTASRLSDAARVGGVLAGRATAAATMEAAAWRALPPLRLKGKREPVAAYELLDLRRRPPTRTGLGDEAPFVGREAELAQLVARLDDVVSTGRPATVLVTGDAGVGKTRLATELARVAADIARAPRVLWGRCTPYGDGRDLAPVLEIVRTACGIGDADDEETARERVRRTVGRLAYPGPTAWAQGLFADRLLGLLGLAGEDGLTLRASATPGDAGSAETESVAAVAGLLQALADEGPLVVVVDDLHWGAPVLRTLLAESLARVSGPLLLVLAARRDLLTPEHDTWLETSMPSPTVLALEPLEEVASERLLRAYLGGSALDEASRQALLSRAQGNPFFLAELLHLLVDRGVLRRESDGWLLAGALPQDVLPAGVHAVLAARIDDLDAPAKDALRDAAVVGAEFRADAVSALAGAPAGDRLAVLVDRDIVRPVGDGAYVFGHMLTREVAYAGIPKAARARRHAQVARWAAESLPGTPAEVDAYVAQHAERAAALGTEMGVPVDEEARSAGFDALCRLGQAALGRDANVEALALLDRAFALGGTPPAAVRLAHARALAACHRLDEAEAALASLEPSAESALVLGDVRRKRGDEDGAVAAFEEALASGDERTAGEATRELGLVDYFAGRLRDAEVRFGDALALAERHEDLRGTGWALQHLAWSTTTRGDYDLADAHLARGIEVFLTIGDMGGVAWCVGTEAFVRMLQGRLGEARALCRDLVPRAEEMGDRWGIAATLTVDAIAAAELGDVSGGAASADRAIALFGELDDAWGRALALVARGMAARARGDSASAVRDLVAAVELSEAVRQPSSRMVALETLAWSYYWDRAYDSAEAAATTAIDLANAMGLERHAQIGAHVVLALVDRARGSLASALRVLGEIARSPEQPTLLFPMRQALAHYAGTLLDDGRPAEALEAARRAVATPAEDVRSRVVALRALGSALRANGAYVEAEETLRTALAEASATEQSQEREQTERVLNDLLASL